MAKILSYLPPSDLLSCTRVSSVWEGEARKHLLKGVPTTPLCCSTVSQYFEAMSLRGQLHTHLELSLCSSPDCLSTLVAKLKETNSLQKVTSLTTHWISIEQWIYNFATCRLFTHLKTLELRPRLDQLNWDRRDFIWNPHPSRLTLPSVQTFNCDLTDVSHIDMSLSPFLWNMIPKVATLRCYNAHGHFLDRIEALSRRNITRLEFSAQKSDWEDVLEEYAPTLEHLTITGVKNIASGNGTRVLCLHTLPKLKVFQVRWSSTKGEIWAQGNCHLVHHPERGRLDLKLKFETAIDDLALDYATQFPSLVRLEVINEDKEKDMDEYAFETCVQFLYDSFLPPPSATQGPCTTLRRLSIATPKTGGTGTPEKWRGLSCGDCDFLQLRRRLQTSLEVETEFYARMATTFPNMENMEAYKPSAEVNQETMEHDERLREWLLLGEKLGLVTGLGHLKMLN